MRCPACDHDNIPGDDLCAGCGLDLVGLDVQSWGVAPQDPFLTMPLAELPLKDPLILGPEASVTEAIHLMKEHHEGCVFVLEDERLVGVFSERDVCTRVAAPGRDPEKTGLNEVMTPSPLALQKTDALAWALHRMGVDGYRHIPVLEENKLIGFLSMRTVLKVLAEA